jgi:mono/diheme cytochrome c family protein
MTMKTLLLIVTAAFATVVVSAQTPAPAPATQTAPAGNSETGRKLYVSYGCWQCHGYEGQGGAAGPRLAPRPLPFAGFSRYVRRPTNQMPPYTEKVVPNTDLEHIHAFLTSRPAPPPAQSIPLLQK